MKAGHLHRVISEKPLDPFPKRLPDTMTQFDMVEAEREDFPQHLVAAGVTVGIPAGGEREHETGVRTQEPGARSQDSGVRSLETDTPIPRYVSAASPATPVPIIFRPVRCPFC